MGDDKIDVIIDARFSDISKSLEGALSELKDVMTIPVERLRSAMTKDSLISYCKIRSMLLEIFPMIEIMVGSVETEMRCLACGKPAETAIIDGVSVLKGEVTHWVENGHVVHDYTCDECIRKIKKNRIQHNK